jgi:hypothetical protein
MPPDPLVPSDPVNLIRQSVAALIGHSGFRDWREDLPVKEGDLILLNNSFVYRNVRTVKSDRYLALRAGKDGNVLPEPVTARGLSINADFKYIAHGSKNTPELTALGDAVQDELAGIGTLVFILLGQIDDSIAVSTTLNHDAFDTVVWNPAQADLVEFAGNTLSVKDTYDEDAVSQAVRAHYEAQGQAAPEGLSGKLSEALDRLQDQAMAALTIPDGSASLADGITDAIVEVLREQRELYAAALERCGGMPERDRAAFNEILRIAYNFASDATTFLTLIVSICDLKPIVLWGTIGEHHALSEAFRSLPWTRSRTKPSLNNYINAIGDARNSAFHNLFPFRKTLKVQLPEAAVQGANLLIFSEHGKKKDNQLVYQDKELVDVLTEFTRARERRVPPKFWQANLAVMDTTIALFDATSANLKCLCCAAKPSGLTGAST